MIRVVESAAVTIKNENLTSFRAKLKSVAKTRLIMPPINMTSAIKANSLGIW